MLYDRKHFCLILTNLSSLSHNRWPFNFHQKFPLLSSDLKNVLTKHFPKMKPIVMFFKIGVIINFLIFTRKYLCWSLFLIKLQDWSPATLLKKRPQHQCFPVNITKCMTKTFFMEHLWKWLKNFQEFLKAVIHRTICMIRLI